MSPNVPKRRKLKHHEHTMEDKPNRLHNEGQATVCAIGESNSSLLKLQVDELLKEVQPSYDKKLSGVDDALQKIKNLIESIEERELLPITEASSLLQKACKVSIPYPDPQPSKNAAYKLAYEKPFNINVIGSYALKTMAKSKSILSVDLMVVMPNSIFQEKDYLNYRYFYKRAYYLACIAAGLESSSAKEFEYQYEYSHGNNLLPILVASIKPSNLSSVKPAFRIRILPAAPANLFAAAKLRPDKNSIRLKDETASEIVSLSSTPFYNASLSSDRNMVSYLKLIHASTKSSEGFRNACILGRIWLQQRGFSSDIAGGGFGHFEWAAITALLLRGGGPKSQPVLSSGYSSFQMFKACLLFLSSNEFASKPFMYQAADIVFQKSNVPVFYDGPREHNLLYKMSPWSYKALRHEVKISLETLNNKASSQFDSTFVIKICQPLLRFDCSFSLSPRTNTIKTNSSDHTMDIRKFSYHLYDVLRQGLVDRVNLIYISEPSSVAWSTKSARPVTRDDLISISVTFDPANIGRLVDHGPPAEEKSKAAKFRNFWGEKAELRRFKDGRILESLVWPSTSLYPLFESIVRYIISRHFGLETNKSLTFVGGVIEELLPDADTGLKNYETLMESFKVLRTQLHNLEGLPLQIKQLSATDPRLRYASIESPMFGPGRILNNPVEVLLQFEASGKWPDDLIAIQRAKVAFLLKIGALLEDADGVTCTRIGLENECCPVQNYAFLDIIYQAGPVFRLRIHHDREQTLLERQIKDKSTSQQSRDDAVTALFVYRRACLQTPLLSQSISTHCTRFPLLSPTIRLVKLWFDRHMLLGHFGEELIELIVARSFVHPYPWQAPSSLITAFSRTMLFLSRWDWKSTPIVVDFTGAMTTDELESVITRLEAWRKIDPNFNRTVLVVSSNHDKTGTTFSDRRPSKLIASRMTALARSAYKIIKDKGYELEPKPLFTASTTEYDFVIHLSRNFTTDLRENKASQPKYKNLEIQSETNIFNVGYQPVQLYLAELENLYSNHIVFFHSTSSGSIITGLWNPQSVTPRSFKVNLSYSTNVLEKEKDGLDLVAINKSAILAEIARLGGDMVSMIKCKD